MLNPSAKAAILLLFIGYQNALIKSAPTFADSSVNCAAVSLQLTLARKKKMPFTTLTGWKKQKGNANRQFAVYSLQLTTAGNRIYVARYCKNTENWFVWWNNVCTNSIRTPTLYIIYIHTYIQYICSEKPLQLSDRTKMKLRIYIAFHFMCTPWGSWLITLGNVRTVKWQHEAASRCS